MTKDQGRKDISGSQLGMTCQDSWRVFRIMAEFVEGFESLAGIGQAVSVFGMHAPGRKTRSTRRRRRRASSWPAAGLPSSRAVDRASWKRPTRALSRQGE